ncbi:DUF2510 domain-containing protein, partial [Streptomyces sp. CBMA370]
MATPPGGGGEVPQAGYYPDPSIPGYIRYWNGGAWVPGTSRPAPKDGEGAPHPPAPAAPAGPILAPGPAPLPVVPAVPDSGTRDRSPARFPGQTSAPGPARQQAPTPHRQPDPHPQQRPDRMIPAPAPVPALEETGPVFFDEDPEPASAWQANASRQTGFGGELDRKVSWGAPPAPEEWPVAGGDEPAHPTDPRGAGSAARLGGMPVTPMPGAATPVPGSAGPVPGAVTPSPGPAAPMP